MCALVVVRRGDLGLDVVDVAESRIPSPTFHSRPVDCLFFPPSPMIMGVTR